MRDLPLQLQTAYQDLLHQHTIEPKLSIEGSILQQKKAGRVYWIARKRLGDKIVDKAIGPDGDDVRARVEIAKREHEIHKGWSRAAAADVAMLRAGRCLAPDMQTGRLLAAISKTGFFQAGGILGGAQAFRHYPLLLGVETTSISFAHTGDVDLLAAQSVRLSGEGPGLAARIQECGIEMEAVFGLGPDQPPKWRVGSTIELEFLSPAVRGGEQANQHPGLGERVQSLRYLEYTLKNPIRAVSLYRTGVPILIPAPERYALHKLIVAQLRSGMFREKKAKDIRQAEWLIDVLAERRPFELWQAWAELRRRGKKWKSLAERSLADLEQARLQLRDLDDEFGD